ncbi:MAG: hypothetical protein JWP44_4364 [Mucilaginibacter sp.]|jgi:hypothetical protein|nr:hypothetical protein [Mucilaginibacter sp.]
MTALIISDAPIDRDFAHYDAAADRLEAAREEADVSVTLDEVLEALTPEQRTQIDRHIARWELRHAGLILAKVRETVVEATVAALLARQH